MKRKKFSITTKTITTIVLFIATFAYCVSYSKMICYDCVDRIGKECNGIEHLDDFVSYDMLNSKYKKQIGEEDFNFKTDEDIWLVCQKFQAVDSGHKSRKSDFATHSLRHNPLNAQIEADGAVYNVVFDITFSPRLFGSKPRITDWSIDLTEVQKEE